MLSTLKLLLPALLPSWRFFDVIAPSPRVQFTLLSTETESPHAWHEFRPRPATLSFATMLKRMIWNPEWNESLFLTSCAERLMEHPTQHSEDEIMTRIINDLRNNTQNSAMMAATHVQFRLLLVQRQGAQLHQNVTYHSRIQALHTRDVA